MTPIELVRAIQAHQGSFVCSRINHPSETKVVHFRHEITPAGAIDSIPDIGRLRDFYTVAGSVTFYFDETSGDAARYIASVDEWSRLRRRLQKWLDGLDEDEGEEIPQWVETCLVIGEEPNTGNCVLMATQGPEAGAIYHFEHDGFEFNRYAGDLIEYAESLLDLDDGDLAYIAAHMRFVEGDDYAVQWWIEELSDNRGNTARTRV